MIHTYKITGMSCDGCRTKVEKTLNAVDEVEENGNQYQLQTSDPEKVKKQLLEFSLQTNLDIISLKSKSKSLEEVFRNLTS